MHLINSFHNTFFYIISFIFLFELNFHRNAYYLTAWKLGKYYRTYDDYVEDEVRQAMQFPDKQFQPGTCNQFGSLDERYAFVCVDENYISARWPGDCYKLADTILEMINPVNH